MSLSSTVSDMILEIWVRRHSRW